MSAEDKLSHLKDWMDLYIETRYCHYNFWNIWHDTGVLVYRSQRLPTFEEYLNNEYSQITQTH